MDQSSRTHTRCPTRKTTKRLASRFCFIRSGFALLGTVDQLPLCNNQLIATCVLTCLSLSVLENSNQAQTQLHTHRRQWLVVLFAQLLEQRFLENLGPHTGLGLTNRTVGRQENTLFLAKLVKRVLRTVNIGLDLLIIKVMDLRPTIQVIITPISRSPERRPGETRPARAKQTRS